MLNEEDIKKHDNTKFRLNYPILSWIYWQDEKLSITVKKKLFYFLFFWKRKIEGIYGLCEICVDEKWNIIIGRVINIDRIENVSTVCCYRKVISNWSLLVIITICTNFHSSYFTFFTFGFFFFFHTFFSSFSLSLFLQLFNENQMSNLGFYSS